METYKRKFNLTPKQKKAFEFIEKYIEENDTSPNHEEIAEGLGLLSKSGVSRLVHGLRDRNWIDFIPNAARSITIIKEQSDEG